MKSRPPTFIPNTSHLRLIFDCKCSALAWSVIGFIKDGNGAA